MLLLQNETNAAFEAAELAKEIGMQVLYAAAPFDADATQAILPLADILVLNAVELAQLQDASGNAPEELGPKTVIITEGSKGARAITPAGEIHVNAFPVKAIDTTGAGDTFTGYLAAALHEGQPLKSALRLASAAAALKVTKKGTADAIPPRVEVDAVLKAKA